MLYMQGQAHTLEQLKKNFAAKSDLELHFPGLGGGFFA